MSVDERMRTFGFWGSYTRTNAKGEFALPAIMPDESHRMRATMPGYSGAARREATPPAKDVDFILKRRT